MSRTNLSYIKPVKIQSHVPFNNNNNNRRTNRASPFVTNVKPNNAAAEARAEFVNERLARFASRKVTTALEDVERARRVSEVDSELKRTQLAADFSASLRLVFLSAELQAFQASGANLRTAVKVINSLSLAAERKDIGREIAKRRFRKRIASRSPAQEEPSLDSSGENVPTALTHFVSLSDANNYPRAIVEDSFEDPNSNSNSSPKSVLKSFKPHQTKQDKSTQSGIPTAGPAAM